MITPAEVDKMDVEIIKIDNLENEVDEYIRNNYNPLNNPFFITVILDNTYNDATMHTLLYRYYKAGWYKIYFRRSDTENSTEILLFRETEAELYVWKNPYQRFTLNGFVPVEYEK